MKIKRLFLFAGYDKQGIIDDTLIYYLKMLSGYGDIVFVMDNVAPNAELNKLNNIPNILYKSAERHGEYDFGSYKRGYQWADKNGTLKKYDWVYLVNDSVYGPLFDIRGILEDLESRNVDLTGMIDFTNKFTPIQVQSWFVGLSNKVANSDFIRSFMDNISSQTNKQLIVLKYEVGLSQVILRHGYKMSTLISGENGDVVHRIYEEPLNMLKAGLPFIKKQGLKNLQGMQYLYPFTTDFLVDAIYRNAVRTGLPLAEFHYEIPKYKKSYRLTLFSIPLLTIYRQRHDNVDTVCYKAYIFDFIPVMKILLRK